MGAWMWFFWDGFSDENAVVGDPKFPRAGTLERVGLVGELARGGGVGELDRGGLLGTLKHDE